MLHQAHRIRFAVSLCLGGACSAFALQASSQMPPPGPDIFVVKHTVDKCAMAGEEDTSRKLAARKEGDGSGAPFSAVGTTEVVTTLADGNRIVRKNTMRYFRDGQGRMRTEFELAAVGPVALDEKHTIVTINDPVAKERYVLHPEEKRADVFKLGALAKGAVEPRVNMAIGKAGAVWAHGAPAGGVAVFTGPMGGPALDERPMKMAGGCEGQTKALPAPVSLGERTIEGLKTVGSRLEFTIPAGEFGNELPMTVRSEQWFSPDLGMVVLSTHLDPMSGETTYRLTQISRAEPDAALFTLPSGYTKHEVAGPQMFHRQIRREGPAAQDAAGTQPGK